MEHSRTRIIIDGAIAGLIGAVVVAVWFLLFDLIRGHALETPALLAATILHGSHSHEVHHGLALLALEYSLLHFGAFITFGIAGGLLLEACETESSLLFSLVIFFVAFEVFFIAVVLFLGPNVMVELTWWGIIVGNLLATGAMLSYFFWRHPALAFNLLGGWISDRARRQSRPDWSAASSSPCGSWSTTSPPAIRFTRRRFSARWYFKTRA